MSILWPSRLNPAPTALTRLGRVLHWIGVAVALVSAGLGAWMTAVYWSSSSPEAGIVMFGGFAIVVYFAGRALRYVFSGE